MNFLVSHLNNRTTCSMVPVTHQRLPPSPSPSPSPTHMCTNCTHLHMYTPDDVHVHAHRHTHTCRHTGTHISSFTKVPTPASQIQLEITALIQSSRNQKMSTGALGPYQAASKLSSTHSRKLFKRRESMSYVGRLALP